MSKKIRMWVKEGIGQKKYHSSIWSLNLDEGLSRIILVEQRQMAWDGVIFPCRWDGLRIHERIKNLRTRMRSRIPVVTIRQSNSALHIYTYKISLKTHRLHNSERFLDRIMKQEWRSCKGRGCAKAPPLLAHSPGSYKGRPCARYGSKEKTKSKTKRHGPCPKELQSSQRI